MPHEFFFPRLLPSLTQARGVVVLVVVGTHCSCSHLLLFDGQNMQLTPCVACSSLWALIVQWPNHTAHSLCSSLIVVGARCSMAEPCNSLPHLLFRVLIVLVHPCHYSYLLCMLVIVYPSLFFLVVVCTSRLLVYCLIYAIYLSSNRTSTRHHQHNV